MSVPGPPRPTMVRAASAVGRGLNGLQLGRRPGLAPVRRPRDLAHVEALTYSWITPPPITTSAPDVARTNHTSRSGKLPYSQENFETVISDAYAATYGAHQVGEIGPFSGVEGGNDLGANGERMVSALVNIGYVYTWDTYDPPAQIGFAPDPPPGFVTEYEYGTDPAGAPQVLTARIFGRMSSDINDAGIALSGDTTHPVQLRQLAPTAYTLDVNGTNVIPIWQTPGMVSVAPVLATVTPGEDAIMYDFDTPFEFDSNGHAVFIVVLQDFHPTGAQWPLQTDWGQANFLVGANVHAPASDPLAGNPYVEIIWQRQRYRYVPDESTPAGDWTYSTAWGAWVWDAGLYLEARFSNMDGYPDTLPAGATEFDFYCVPGSSNFVDGTYGTPEAHGIRTGPDPGDYFYEALYGDFPDAGSHLWVVWFGTDPTGTDPAPLVPSWLAEHGTGP